MKHLGWNPEGKLNKDLMLGTGWNDTEGFLDDNFAGPASLPFPPSIPSSLHPSSTAAHCRASIAGWQRTV